MTQSAPDLAEPHRLILVRHGQTPHTADFRISGAGFRPEPGLDPVGEQQALAAARRLARLSGPIDEVLVSPLRRTRQTAAVIVAELGAAEPRVVEAWSEAHFGRWEGMSVPDVVEQYPGAWEAMMADAELAPPGGESLSAVRRRVVGAWDAVTAPGRTTLVITHLTPIRIVVAHALSTPQESFGRVVALPGSITLVERWADQGAAVLAVGERPDLAEDRGR